MSHMTREEIVLMVAKVCHEANRAYCHSIGDFTQLSWEATSDEIKQSAIDGAYNCLHNDRISPEESHEFWVKTKKEQGWKYGEIKDLAAKTHPCMVPYSRLPEEHRVKDHLFTSICAAFIKQYKRAS